MGVLSLRTLSLLGSCYSGPFWPWWACHRGLMPWAAAVRRELLLVAPSHRLPSQCFCCSLYQSIALHSLATKTLCRDNLVSPFKPSQYLIATTSATQPRLANLHSLIATCDRLAPWPRAPNKFFHFQSHSQDFTWQKCQVKSFSLFK